MQYFPHIIASVYLVSFISFYLQFPGLNGYNGIQPVSLWADLVKQNLKTVGKFDLTGGKLLIYLNEGFGYPPEVVCECLVWIGTICCIQLVFSRNSLITSLYFAAVWICYAVLAEAEGLFYSFQWDILLQECGFLCCLSSLFNCAHVSAYSFRFLAWKLLFLSGAVKLQARCPTW